MKSSKLRADVVADGCRNIDRRCGSFVSEMILLVVVESDGGVGAKVDVVGAVLTMGVTAAVSGFVDDEDVDDTDDDGCCGAVVCRCMADGDDCPIDGIFGVYILRRSVRFVLPVVVVLVVVVVEVIPVVLGPVVRKELLSDKSLRFNRLRSLAVSEIDNSNAKRNNSSSCASSAIRAVSI